MGNTESRLWAAALSGNVEEVRQRIAVGDDVNQTDKYGQTPLFAACWKGHTEVVRVLLQNKADPNAAANNKATPLHLSALYGHLGIAQLLLQYDANVHAATMNLGTPLHVAAHYGHPYVARLLLQQSNAQVDAVNSRGSSPLHNACVGSGHPQVVAVLLSHRATVSIRDNEGKIPLDLTSSEEIKRMLQRLDHNTSDQRLVVNEAEEEQKRQFAEEQLQSIRSEMEKQLQEDELLKSPKQLAKKRDSEELLRLLEEANRTAEDRQIRLDVERRMRHKGEMKLREESELRAKLERELGYAYQESLYLRKKEEESKLLMKKTQSQLEQLSEDLKTHLAVTKRAPNDAAMQLMRDAADVHSRDAQSRDGHGSVIAHASRDGHRDSSTALHHMSKDGHGSVIGMPVSMSRDGQARDGMGYVSRDGHRDSCSYSRDGSGLQKAASHPTLKDPPTLEVILPISPRPFTARHAAAECWLPPGAIAVDRSRPAIADSQLRSIYHGWCFGTAVVVKAWKNADTIAEAELRRSCSCCKHPFVVVCLGGTKQDDGRFFVAYELMDTSLYKSIHSEKKTIRVEDVLSIALAVAHALSYLHGRAIPHRAVRSSKVMFSGAGSSLRIKMLNVAAFKVLQHLPAEQTYWAAPEAVAATAPEQFDPFAADIYSFGILVLEAFEKRLPVLIREKDDGFHNTPELWRRLIQHCCDREVFRRPASMSDVVNRLSSEHTRFVEH